MPVPSAVIGLALLDCGTFVAAWVRNSLRAAAGLPASLLWRDLYSVAGFVGLALAVYGFLVVVRGGLLQGGLSALRRGALVVLFAMVPGCGGLEALLSYLGRHPV